MWVWPLLFPYKDICFLIRQNGPQKWGGGRARLGPEIPKVHYLCERKFNLSKRNIEVLTFAIKMSASPADQLQQFHPKPPSILKSLRLWTFSASLTPVALGATLCYRALGYFSVPLLLLTVGAVLAVNGAGNMVNSYFDSMRKLDSLQRHMPVKERHVGAGSEVRHRRPVHKENGSVGEERSIGQERAQHQLDQSALVNYAAYLYGFGMLCMLMLMTLSRAKSEFIAALFFGGLSSSFLYTGGVGLKYYILGDLLVVFTFGPLSMLFSYGVQGGHFPVGPLVLALPLAFSTEAILHSKHLREMEEDRRAGVISLAVLLGKHGSYFFFTLLLFLPYLLFAVFATQYSVLLGLPLLSMPYAFQLERTLREEGPSRAISVKAAKLNVAVSTLFIFGCLLAKDMPFIELVV